MGIGLLDSFKGAGNAWGFATGSCFDGIGYFGPEKALITRNQRLMVSSPTMKESIIFGKEDVARIDTLFATSEWIKFRFILHDGKEFIVTIKAMGVGPKASQLALSVMNLEWWLADIIYK